MISLDTAHEVAQHATEILQEILRVDSVPDTVDKHRYAGPMDDEEAVVPFTIDSLEPGHEHAAAAMMATHFERDIRNRFGVPRICRGPDVLVSTERAEFIWMFWGPEQ